MSNLSEIFIFATEEFYPEVIKGIEDGTVTIRNGVAYLDGKILQHLPIKSVTFDPEKLNELSNLISKTNIQQIVATGLSTSIILGAIVIQTIYLSKKIDILQKTMDEIANEINTQNLIFYIDKISHYFGIVETARVLIQNQQQDLIQETAHIANTIISDLSIARNQVMSFIDNILSIVDNQTGKHLEHMLNFVTSMLDILPKAIYIESQFCIHYNKISLSKHIGTYAADRYNNILKYYHEWYKDKRNLILNGKGIDNNMLNFFENNFSEIKYLFNSPINEALLALPNKPNIFLADNKIKEDRLIKFLTS